MNWLKNWLRAWLGIDQLATDVAVIEQEATLAATLMAQQADDQVVPLDADQMDLQAIGSVPVDGENITVGGN